mmetsp:Transcript_58586/g.130898  ORF Transcript_58586/g.130898 Transcript_58586/m.130898 type:complete len:101 (+) Transcript_58586:259-561(+)
MSRRLSSFDMQCSPQQLTCSFFLSEVCDRTDSAVAGFLFCKDPNSMHRFQVKRSYCCTWLEAVRSFKIFFSARTWPQAACDLRSCSSKRSPQTSADGAPV